MKEIIFKKYNTWIFDCDGVLLDSNKIKTEIFYEVCLPYGSNYASQFVEYHKANGGISRYKKFEYFFQHIIKIDTDYKNQLHEILVEYSNKVKQKLLNCDITKGAISFIQSLPKEVIKVVVSGSDQEELRDVFNKRNLDKYFNGIYGSPNSKFEIIEREIKNNVIKKPCIFIGDSRIDFITAKQFNFDFIFISDYTEMNDYQHFLEKNNIYSVKNLSELHYDIFHSDNRF